MAYADTPFVKILTGIRRCGTSAILKMLIDEMKDRGINGEQILHYFYDSLEYEDIKTEKVLFAHLKQNLILKGKIYLFLYDLFLYDLILYEIQEVKSWEKVYTTSDTALRYSVLGYSANSAAAMLENIICLELLCRGYEVYVGILDNAEIDFIAIKQEKKLDIQVPQGSVPLKPINENTPGYLIFGITIISMSANRCICGQQS